MKIVFTLIGTLMGAGFASGQEVYSFFYFYGIKGIFGIIVSGILIGIVIYKTLLIGKDNRIKTYKNLLENVVKNKQLKNIMNTVVNIFILISFYVMIAGFGAYLEQEYKINVLFGSTILATFCYIVFKINIKGLVKVNEILIPVLLLVIVVLRFIKYKKYQFLQFK